MTETTRLDEILTSDFTTGLEGREMNDLREMKRACDEEEAALSYARRLLQGKIDLLRAELATRSSRGSNGSGPAISDIASVLASDQPRGFRGRFPRIMIPPETRETRKVLALLADPVMTNLETVTDAELREAETRLAEEERGISQKRNDVHEQIAMVETEIARRYATGESSVDDIL